MKEMYAFALIGMLLTISGAAGCSSSKTESDDIINLTIWHVYGGQTDSPLNNLIDEFNRTVGKEEGIQVEVTMVSNTNTIQKDVLAAANGDPGAAELPDIFTSYPKTVLAMPDDSVLVDYRDYLTEEELSAFIPAFLEDGQINGRQVILPVARSTEIMFVNKTIFDRFAAETGASLESLRTWEGLFRTACQYAEWTDAQTPDVENDPKSFFVHDYHFNYFQVGVESLGSPFFDGDGIDFGHTFRKVWEPYAEAALCGGVWLGSGYATDPLRTGDTVVSVASSASVLYYSDIVTYPDNTSENIEMIALPCPVFEDGENLVMQRGAGMCVVKSTPEREQAALTFLKWLTEPECNARFVTQVGYMPVTQESFDNYLSEAVKSLTDPKYISLYDAYQKTYEKYHFYNAPQLETYLSLESRFEEDVRLCLQNLREEYLTREAGSTLESLTEKGVMEFRDFFSR